MRAIRMLGLFLEAENESEPLNVMLGCIERLRVTRDVR